MNDLQNFDVEQEVLGLILSHHQHLDTVRDKLSVEDFYTPEHQDIFSLCCQLQDEGKRPSPVDIRPLLQRNDAGKILAQLVGLACLPMTLEQRCDTIKELSNRRKISQSSEETIKKAQNLEIPLEQITANLESALDVVSDSGGEWKTVALADVVDEVFDVLESPDDVNYVPTGIKPLDDIIAGLFPSFLYIIAGRPGMAKTTNAVNIAYNIASQGHPVALFNLEMANIELIPRLLCNAVYEEREIAYQDFATKSLNATEMDIVRTARHDLYKLPLVVRDEPYMTISKLHRECKKIKRKIPDLKVIIVDYLQLLKGGSRYKGNRVLEIGEITRGMKGIAKELKIAFVALSQLSRGVEQRENKRPYLSDLRDSGAIEQDADVAMFTYYHHYYLEKEEPKKAEDHLQWSSDLAACRNKLEIIVAKRRNGRTGIAHCRYSAPAAAIR